MQKFKSRFVFFLRKLGLSFLVILDFVIGIFCWALTIYPFNFPYLLRLPEDATNSILSVSCGLLFVSIVTVRVRTKWCYENDLFFSKEDHRFLSLVKRIVISPEFITDTIVFAVWMLALGVWAAPSGTPWYAFLLGFLTSLLVCAPVFAVLDCLLYVIARKKADKQLFRREEG